MNLLEEYGEELKLLKKPSEKLALYLEEIKAFKVGSFICKCDLILPNNIVCNKCHEMSMHIELKSFCNECGRDLILKGKAQVLDLEKHFCNKHCYLKNKRAKKLSTVPSLHHL